MIQRSFIAITLCTAAVFGAHAEVTRASLPYLERMTVGEATAEVVANLGMPDFVILPTDQSDAGQSLREDGIARQLVWTVKGCQPVRIDVDARGRTTGANYAALKSMCLPEIAQALTPSAAHSCKLDARKVHCR